MFTILIHCEYLTNSAFQSCSRTVQIIKEFYEHTDKTYRIASEWKGKRWIEDRALINSVGVRKG
jgi:hypothetical protein